MREDAHKGIRAAHAAGCPAVAIPNEWTSKNDFSTASRVVARLDEVSLGLIHALATPGA